MFEAVLETARKRLREVSPRFRKRTKRHFDELVAAFEVLNGERLLREWSDPEDDPSEDGPIEE